MISPSRVSSLLMNQALLSVPLLLCLALPGSAAEDPYPEFYKGEGGTPKDAARFIKAINVLEPAYRSEINGDVKIVFRAPGMLEAKAFCWQQPTPDKPDAWGHDVELANLKLDPEGTGSFSFPSDTFPNGPVTIRIHTRNQQKQDICELQLYNLGGEVWNQGIPKSDPPGARGLKLLFADDFDGPLSISPDGKNARYAAHKSGGGDFSGWSFSDPGGDNKPFGQVGTFMRIRASKEPGTKGCTGIISSLRNDGTGFETRIPAYFECRFVAQSAPGTWPAFWTLTRGIVGLVPGSPEYVNAKKTCDEHDIIEAYGGYGPKNPNAGGIYSCVTHFWGQSNVDWYEKKTPDGKPNPYFKPHSARNDTITLGGKSSWSWTFHTYGLAIGEKETIYYFDNIEVLRHPTGELSKVQPHWFLVNYAIGGISGWKIDLERYGNGSDMYVDFVRVYGRK